MPRIYTLIPLSIILLASFSSPATTLPTEVLTDTPQLTNTPVPTNTNTLTPTLEPWMVSLPEGKVSVEIKNDTVFGLDTQGSQFMQFDLADGEWKEVVKELIILAKNEQMARELKTTQPPENLVRIFDVNGNPYDYGFLGNIFPGERNYFSAKLLVW